jgi:hypothetical protein
MMRRTGFALAAWIALAGCACSEKRPVVYTPPRVVAQFAPGLTMPDNGYHVLADVHTEGRFACPLAVAKFAPPPNAALPFVPIPTRPEEEAYWTEQLRGVTAIREVIFMRSLDARPDEATVATLCAAAQRKQAPLLLTYLPDPLGPNSAQILGVVYDTASAQPLATLHAAVRFVDEHGIEASPNKKKGDHRAIDGRYQAQRAFEVQALACLRDMIHLDVAPPTTQPHHWQQPLTERWWIRSRR